ncbi:MAG: glycosyltransferase [Bryobacteraceae bacterium]
MTAGFFSPLPPAPTGIADYSAALLDAMRAGGDLRVNVPGDIDLYHLGNNPLHAEIYRRALRTPGVAVLHDAVLHHFMLGVLDRRAYTGEFVFNYGEWSRALAEDLWRERSRAAHDPRYFEYALVKRIAEASRAVVVHNPGAAAIVARHAPAARVVEIPHLFAAPALPEAGAIQRWREAHGLSPRTFLFGVFGYLREAKRLPAILRAFGRVREAGCDAALLVAGRFGSESFQRSLAPLLEAPGVLRAGYAPEREFWLMASAVDACVSLRYPSAGETSGITVRLMGLGKPVLVTAGEETALLPETACLHVDAGVAEEAMLKDYMLWLASSPEAARQIGCRAAAHIKRYHSPAEAARRYWEVLCSC